MEGRGFRIVLNPGRLASASPDGINFLHTLSNNLCFAPALPMSIQVT
jgi:hypothetical protein